MPVDIEPFQTIDQGLSYWIDDADCFIAEKRQWVLCFRTIIRDVERLELIDGSIQAHSNALEDFREKTVAFLESAIKLAEMDSDHAMKARNSLADLQNRMRNFFNSLDEGT